MEGISESENETSTTSDNNICGRETNMSNVPEHLSGNHEGSTNDQDDDMFSDDDLLTSNIDNLVPGPSTSSSTSKSNDGTLKLMSLNDNKAGMTGLDKEKINAIIQNASKGSKFYAKQQENQARIDSQIEKLKIRHESLTNKDLLLARQEADLYIDHLNQELDLSRSIVHVDMDMFYAAVEMRDNPDLRDKPMAVGGMGMLSTSNYAARKFGVRAAMPGFIGKKLCPELVIVPGNMEKYANESKVIREVFREYDENFAPMSLDEAYMDITDYLLLNPETNSCDAVQEMRTKITERTQLTASAGIAPNTFLAKVCSDLNKPNGQYVMEPNQDKIIDFIRKLPIRKAPGIGNVQEQLLKSIGVETCGDLYELRAEIKLLFSQLSFEHYMQVSQGIGSTRLEAPEDRIRKSISTETTFKDTSDRSKLLELCDELSKELSDTMKEKEIFGQAVAIKIKSHDFKIKTKIRQIAAPTNDFEALRAVAKQLLQQLLDSSEEQPLALRLLGVRMSELKSKEEVGVCKQKSIFSFFNNSTQATQKRDSQLEQQTKQGEHVNNEAELSKQDMQVPEVESSKLDIQDKVRHNTAKEKISRQKSISSFLQNSIQRSRGDLSNLENGRDSEVSTTESEYFCPICGEVVSGLHQLNSHVDQCLAKGHNMADPSSEVDDEDIINDLTDLANEKIENEVEITKEAAPKTDYKKISESSSNTGPSGSDTAPLGSDKGPPGSDTAPSSTTMLTCPVCFSAKFSSEMRLNTHIDECLNSKEIQNVLSSQKSSNHKEENNRKRKSDSSSACGKSAIKKGKLGVNKIDSYFRRS